MNECKPGCGCRTPFGVCAKYRRCRCHHRPTFQDLVNARKGN